MRYLCLGYHDEQTWAAMSDADRRALLADNATYEQRLRGGGHYIDGKALQDRRSTATLRFDDGGRVSITDGPFAETKEQLGGVMVLEAADLN
ncbi:MAG TPA: YciI family protein, partial [Tepidisphaeraceae bacterium]|nr:YciI family protein [Tepidisphaeraceae bacterium]